MMARRLTMIRALGEVVGYTLLTSLAWNSQVGFIRFLSYLAVIPIITSIIYLSNQLRK